ncbi:MAG: hypothetical protein HOE90_03940 [Bacteriovoracaceae bacterium]|nr:hypothetical protein [Bacteriovoracaceae bacterium]
MIIYQLYTRKVISRKDILNFKSKELLVYLNGKNGANQSSITELRRNFENEYIAFERKIEKVSIFVKRTLELLLFLFIGMILENHLFENGNI